MNPIDTFLTANAHNAPLAAVVLLLACAAIAGLCAAMFVADVRSGGE